MGPTELGLYVKALSSQKDRVEAPIEAPAEAAMDAPAMVGRVES